MPGFKFPRGSLQAKNHLPGTSPTNAMVGGRVILSETHKRGEILQDICRMPAKNKLMSRRISLHASRAKTRKLLKQTRSPKSDDQVHMNSFHLLKPREQKYDKMIVIDSLQNQQRKRKHMGRLGKRALISPSSADQTRLVASARARRRAEGS